MTCFRYVAMNPSGKLIYGHLDVKKRCDVFSFLQNKKLSPLRVRKQGFFRQAWLAYGSYPHLLKFFMHLDYGLKGGQTLQKILTESLMESSRKWREVMRSLLVEVQQGSLLSEACHIYPSLFSPVVLALMRLGENSGTFSENCERICIYLKKNHSYKKKLIKVMTYPFFSFFSIVGCIVSLSHSFLPELKGMFLERNLTLPWITRCLLYLPTLPFGYIFSGVFFLFLLGMIGYFLFYPRSMLYFQYLFLNRCPLAIYFARADIAKFLEAFKLLYQQNMPLLNALLIAQKTVGWSFIRNAFDEAQHRITSGASLCDALQDIPFLKNMYLRLLRAGEATGALQSSLVQTASVAGEDLEHSLNLLLEKLPPLLLLFVGGFLILLMMGTILPLYESMESLSYGL